MPLGCPRFWTRSQCCVIIRKYFLYLHSFNQVMDFRYDFPTDANYLSYVNYAKSIAPTKQTWMSVCQTILFDRRVPRIDGHLRKYVAALERLTRLIENGAEVMTPRKLKLRITVSKIY